jgi:hypothetical protein
MTELSATAMLPHQQMACTYRSIEWASPDEPGLLYLGYCNFFMISIAVLENMPPDAGLEKRATFSNIIVGLITLSGFRYLCQELAYLVLSRIFPIASQIDELLESYQDYAAKSVGKQGGEFLIAALVKS